MIVRGGQDGIPESQARARTGSECDDVRAQEVSGARWNPAIRESEIFRPSSCSNGSDEDKDRDHVSDGSSSSSHVLSSASGVKKVKAVSDIDNISDSVSDSLVSNAMSP